VAVRTDKDREIEAKLERLQQDTSGRVSPACQQLQYKADDAQHKFDREDAAFNRGRSDGKLIQPLGDESIKAHDAASACIDAQMKAENVEVFQHLWPELRAAAGLATHD
jgi:hypothetical protein